MLHLGSVEDFFGDLPKVSYDFILTRDDTVDRLYEQVLQCILIQVWRAALVVPVSIFFIALPDNLAIFALGVPHLRPEQTTADSASDTSGKNVGPIPRLHMLGAVLDLFLHQIEDLRCDDGLMVLFYIVLGDFPLFTIGFLVRKSAM